MKRIKVVTIVGTRPEIIRLSRLIPKLDELTDHILVHTGQNYDRQLNDVFFEDLELRQPDYYLDVETSSIGAVMGDTLRKTEEVFLREKPDAVMILGDTNSAIAAVVAERMQIPVYHMEAGNRSFDANVPEELNRKMVDHVASFNLPYNDYSLRNLLDEGVDPRRIFKTGSPIREVFAKNHHRIVASTVLEDLDLKEKSYFLVSMHRQENVDNPSRLETLILALQSLRQEWSLPILVSTHPRTRRELNRLNPELLHGITFHEPFGYLDYNRLQLGSTCVISDSGTIGEECSILGFPAITVRDSMERPEAIRSGHLLMTGLNSDSIIRSVALAVARFSSPQSSYVLPEGYEENNFSDVVISVLFSTVHAHRKWLGLNSI